MVDVARMGTHLKKHLDMTITPSRGKAATAAKGKAAAKAKGKGKGRGKKAGAAADLQEEDGPPAPPPNRDAFVLKIVDSEDHDYWMFARAHVRAKLSDLDELLRETWAGCCPEHKSQFMIRGTMYADEEGGDDDEDEDEEDDYDDDEYEDYDDRFFSAIRERWQPPRARSLDVDLRNVAKHKDKIWYIFGDNEESDFEITVYATASSVKMDAPIGLLARNEPPVFECGSCKAEDASKICGLCIGKDNPMYCTGCLNEHKCGDSRALPVENTPRAGMCPYEGLPDKERKAAREKREADSMVPISMPSSADIREIVLGFLGGRGRR